MSKHRCRERGRSLGSLIERIGRIEGFESEGNIGEWRAEMGVEWLERRPDYQLGGVQPFSAH